MVEGVAILGYEVSLYEKNSHNYIIISFTNRVLINKKNRLCRKTVLTILAGHSPNTRQMAEVKIIWSDRALSDIEEIIAYISKDSEYFAINFATKIISTVEILKSLPWH